MDKQERKAKDPMQDFMKELCKDMKEETQEFSKWLKMEQLNRHQIKKWLLMTYRKKLIIINYETNT